MKKLSVLAASATALAVLLLPLLLSGCNTVEGMGEDLEATGEAIEGTFNE